jgi:hypothetical protein
MNESLIIELWDLLREYGDKKQMSVVAEKFVVVLTDHGASDQDIESCIGHDDDLDNAIKEILAIDEDEADHDSYDYDDDE